MQEVTCVVCVRTMWWGGGVGALVVYAKDGYVGVLIFV